VKENASMAEDSRGGGRAEGTDFIRAIVARHNAEGTYGGRVETRFPPEPNGYLHIGHAKSIVLNFGLARENGGACHLRFDDTNPLTEDMKYVRAIQEDVRWLGYDWGEHLYFASDYFERLHECALILIRKGRAYVDSLSEDEIREYRGTVTEPGRESPHRSRGVEENLDLFRRMKEGEFGDGEHVLRARIDMAHPNMVMRDPVLYRIRHASHYRRGEAWCIYPLYDFTHCLSDAFEDITHSLCTLEFDNNREIYDWLLDEVGFQEPRTHQYEFARLNLDYTVMSKRKLLRLVNEGHVDGWDDPRMPTIAGLRRRGITPEAIRNFCEMIGVAKADNRVDMGKLEYAVRDHLNRTVPRVMGVLNPLRVVITNYPKGEGEELEIPSYPHDVPLEGSRMVPFSRELWIEADDFLEDPPKDYFRLAPGREVRLRYAYFVRCDEVVKDPATGEVVELRCSYDPATRGGNAPDGRKVKGTIHWVSALHALKAEVRLYDRLFTVPDPEAVEGKDFTDCLNPDSRVVIPEAYLEPSVAHDPPGTRYQLERLGYFVADALDSRPGAPVLNRIVTLRDTYAGRGSAALAPLSASGPGSFRMPPSEGKPESAPPSSAKAAVLDKVEALPPRGDRRNTDQEARERARRKHSELAERHRRYQEELGLSEGDADLLSGSLEISAFFDQSLASRAGLRGREGALALANWMVNELFRELKDRELKDLLLTPRGLARLVDLLEEGVISQPVAKEIFAEMVARGADPRAVVAERGLEKLADPAVLEPLVDQVLAAWPGKAEEYRGGKTGLLGFFTGQIMKETQGRADPRVVQDLLRERLG
jgi:glutaminyl-tRNA synthetase